VINYAKRNYSYLTSFPFKSGSASSKIAGYTNCYKATASVTATATTTAFATIESTSSTGKVPLTTIPPFRLAFRSPFGDNSSY
jgi:hypothetical protein